MPYEMTYRDVFQPQFFCDSLHLTTAVVRLLLPFFAWVLSAELSTPVLEAMVMRVAVLCVKAPFFSLYDHHRAWL